MKRVAVLFDNFGNPGQPFLKEWFFRIFNSKKLRIKGFTDKYFEDKDSRITVLKTEGMRKYFRYLQQLLTPGLRKMNLQLVPVVQYAPDVIHLLNAQQVDQYKPLLKNSKIKSVYSFRGFETSVRPQQDAEWAEKLDGIYKRATALHFVSDFLKAEAIKRGAPQEKCVVIRRSVDTDFFKPKENEISNAIHFIAVGRLTWQKGYPLLLEAFAEVAKAYSDTTLTIIGDGPEANAIKEEIVVLGLEKNVKLIPHLDRMALREALWRADIFVQASLSDALPNSILEASACGLPVVSTLAGGIPEAVLHEKSGLLVASGDVTHFQKAMLQLVENVTLRKAFGKQGRQFMMENFSAEQECKKWEAFYLTV